MDHEPLLPIGQVAARAGLTVATLRYYESLGLVAATRTAGNQRRYHRSVLRRLAFVTAARRVGLPLAEVRAALEQLPAEAPTREDWRRVGTQWSAQVAARVRELQALQDTLADCLGCGCLSLTHCALYNPADAAAEEGAGPRWLRDAALGAGDPPSVVAVE